MSQSTSRTLSNLLKDVDLIEIPVIQRDYAQGRSEAKDIREAFLSAIEKSLRDGGAPLNLDFIYGSVEGDSIRTLSVLDGQQRLTTLFLLHWYAANRDGEFEDFRRRWRTGDDRARFRYSTRPSAAAFFRALVLNPLQVPTDDDDVALSRRIMDTKWFIDAWRRDPTVHSALVMLDSIHARFARLEELHQRLGADPRISFQFLELKDFGLQSDELYIKMNSRGKPLTPFENFKAWLVDRITGEPWADSFALRLDQAWVDYFWGLAGRSQSTGFDELFLRFFYLSAYFERARRIENVWTVRSGTDTWLNELRIAPFVALKTFDENDALQPTGLQEVAVVLDYLVSQSGKSHTAIVQAALRPRASYDALLRLYARMAFARETAGTSVQQDAQALQRWTRVTENLISNSRADDLSSAVAAIRGLTALAKHAADLYETLAKGSLSALGFAKDQVDEEATKAGLILADGRWEPLLVGAESHWYLQGRVRALLALSARQAQHPQPEAFRAALDAFRRIATQDILESRAFPLQRALLALYDFLPWAPSGNHTFCMARATTIRDRQENWLPAFEDPNFGQLVDLIGNDGLSSLTAIIASSSATGWRQCLVKDPRLMGYCHKRLIRKHGNVVYLLSKSRLTGYYTEARSYALYFQLAPLYEAGKLTGVTQLDYLHVYGVDADPGLQVRTDRLYTVTFVGNRWRALSEGQEFPLPPVIADALKSAA